MMNCQNFESLINDLAREAAADSGTKDGARADALAHADGCRRCGARLADERALAGGLRSLAGEAKTLEAPARVEAALLSAFRARAAEPAAERPAAPVAPEVIPDGVLAAMSSTVVKRWTWLRTLGTAATAAAAAAAAWMVVGLNVAPPRRDVPAARVEVSRGADDSAPRRLDDGSAARRESAPAPALMPAAASSSGGVASPPPASVVQVGGGMARRSYTPRTGRAVAVVTPRNDRGSRGPGGLAREDDAGTELAAAEITTDFLPLTHGGIAPGDGGQLIRVELPRSALASFGLPVNMDRAGGRVKADVLVGEDGIARAIRFVR